jgi:hypothetical protein
MAQEDPLSPPFEGSDAPTEAANFGGMLTGMEVGVPGVLVEAAGTAMIAGGVAEGEAVAVRTVEGSEPAASETPSEALPSNNLRHKFLRRRIKKRSLLEAFQMVDDASEVVFKTPAVSDAPPEGGFDVASGAGEAHATVHDTLEQRSDIEKTRASVGHVEDAPPQEAEKNGDGQGLRRAAVGKSHQGSKSWSLREYMKEAGLVESESEEVDWNTGGGEKEVSGGVETDEESGEEFEEESEGDEDNGAGRDTEGGTEEAGERGSATKVTFTSFTWRYFFQVIDLAIDQIEITSFERSGLGFEKLL